MNILGIDPGTSCGWAVVGEGGVCMLSGVWDLRPRRHEGGGMRYLRLQSYLLQVLTAVQVKAVAYEEARRHMGVDAAHIYGGVVATIGSVLELRKTPYRGVPVGTVKKVATGKGNADKVAMMTAFQALTGRTPADDNEADALFVALALRKELGL